MTNLQEIKARRGKITQGKWEIPPDEDEFLDGSVNCGDKNIALCNYFESTFENMSVTLEDQKNNADFIANAPTDIDWLIAEVERLREERKNYRRTPMTRLTDERLAEIEERCNATTSGLWETDTGGDVSSNNTTSQGYKNHTICERPHNPLHPCESGLSQQFMNMEFITHARQDIPDLLAEVKALKAEKESMAEEYSQRLPHEIDDYYNAWANQQVEMEQLKKQLTQAEAERDVLIDIGDEWAGPAHSPIEPGK